MADIIHIDGIGHAYKERLAKLNLHTIEDLLAYFQSSPDSVQKLSAKVGVDEDEVQHWKSHAEVWQLPEMTEEYLRMLDGAHVLSLRKLTSFQATVLHGKLANAKKSKSIPGQAPNLVLVRKWISEAERICAQMPASPTFAATAAAETVSPEAPPAAKPSRKPKDASKKAADTKQAEDTKKVAEAKKPEEAKKVADAKKPEDTKKAQDAKKKEDTTKVEVEQVPSSKSASSSSTSNSTSSTSSGASSNTSSSNSSGTSNKTAQDPKPMSILELIVEYAKKAAKAAAIPLPIGDIMAVTDVQMTMLREISNRKSVPYSSSAANAVITGLAPIQSSWSTVSSAIKFFPYLGTVAGMVSGAYAHAATTYAIGYTILDHFNSGGNLSNFTPSKYKSKYDAHYKVGQEMLKGMLKDKIGMK